MSDIQNGVDPMDRVADALERIATAMEYVPQPPEPTAEMVNRMREEHEMFMANAAAIKEQRKLDSLRLAIEAARLAMEKKDLESMGYTVKPL